MKRTEIQPGAVVYVAPDPEWRSCPPTRGVVVDARPHRIIRRRMGAVYLVSHVEDPDGTAVVVDLHETTGVRRTAVPVRHLRGLWEPTLAALGRTEAQVERQRQAFRDLVSSGRPLSGEGLLGLAASDPTLGDDGFVVLRQAVESREIEL